MNDDRKPNDEGRDAALDELLAPLRWHASGAADRRKWREAVRRTVAEVRRTRRLKRAPRWLELAAAVLVGFLAGAYVKGGASDRPEPRRDAVLETSGAAATIVHSFAKSD